jgi:phytoene dehydrogenase-like protein
MTANSYDAIVVGGGHNGLINACYLAKSGLNVLVLERRSFVGGAAITEELHPGFSFTTFSYALSLLRPEVIHELNLVEHGFLPLLLPTAFSPMENGDYLLYTEDEQFNDQEIGRHSRRDVDGYHRWSHDLQKIIQVAKPLFDNAPPDIFSDDPEDEADVAWMMKQLRGGDRKTLHDLVRFLTGSAADLLDDYFESDIVKASIASSSIIGTKVGPMSQGSGLVLLYHLMGEQDGHHGVWGFHKGGNGGFTQVLQRAAQGLGATVKLESPVDHVITKDGRATGVALSDGTEYAAPIVVSALDPRRTFTELVDPRELPERAYDDAKYGWYSQRPFIDGAIQSVVDPDMAPPGKHVMSCFIQYAPYELKGGDWETERQPFADTVQAVLESHFPGFGDLVLHREVVTPVDIERVAGLTEGNIFHGEFLAPQMYFMRPAPGYARYNTPIEGYYQCGSGTHPGGCVSGGPGKLAAMRILGDRKA